MKKIWILALLVAALSASCTRKNGDAVPPAPDYADESAWYVTDRGGAVDLFYVSSTETVDHAGPDGTLWHFATAADSASCPFIRGEMQGVDRILGGDLNFYSPFYRQVTMETYGDSALVARRFPVAMEDVRNAFRYYVDHLGGGRPFVLAGFSQGAQAVVELLREMPDSLHSRMVAAYVLGWKITARDLADAPCILPAKGPDDTGVTVCYNSVREPEDANPMVSGGNDVAINPVNWCTDATPAVLFDTLTVTLDPSSNLLLVDGYQGTANLLPPYFGEGCYHTMEIRWYGESLRGNIAERCRSYLSSKN